MVDTRASKNIRVWPIELVKVRRVRGCPDQFHQVLKPTPFFFCGGLNTSWTSNNQFKCNRCCCSTHLYHRAKPIYFPPPRHDTTIPFSSHDTTIHPHTRNAQSFHHRAPPPTPPTTRSKTQGIALMRPKNDSQSQNSTNPPYHSSPSPLQLQHLLHLVYLPLQLHQSALHRFSTRPCVLLLLLPPIVVVGSAVVALYS